MLKCRVGVRHDWVKASSIIFLKIFNVIVINKACMGVISLSCLVYFVVVVDVYCIFKEYVNCLHFIS